MATNDVPYVDFNQPNIFAAWLNDVANGIYRGYQSLVSVGGTGAAITAQFPQAPRAGVPQDGQPFLLVAPGTNGATTAPTLTLTNGPTPYSTALPLKFAGAALPANFYAAGDILQLRFNIGGWYDIVAYPASYAAPLVSPAFTGAPTAPTPATADNTTKIATTAMVQAAIAASAGAMFPVNSVYLTTSNVNPGTFLPGTWALISQGRVLVGVGTGTDKNSVTQTFGAGNDTVGEYVHTQTVPELAGHDHTWQATGAGVPVGSDQTAWTTIAGAPQNTSTTGTSTPFNVTQPSFGVYIWQRTA